MEGQAGDSRRRPRPVLGAGPFGRLVGSVGGGGPALGSRKETGLRGVERSLPVTRLKNPGGQPEVSSSPRPPAGVSTHVPSDPGCPCQRFRSLVSGTACPPLHSPRCPRALHGLALLVGPHPLLRVWLSPLSSATSLGLKIPHTYIINNV